MTERIEGHGGALAVAALRAAGVTEMFTLSGGHVFPLYDAAHQTVPGTDEAAMRIIDVRHEQSAVFAAEAVAKLQRRPGLAVLTAGPGVTNGISGLTSAYFNASPVLVMGGRAPAFRWGSGSLQEIDHLPLVAPVTKHAATVLATDEIPAAVTGALATALTPHRGPVFLDLPLEVVFSVAEATAPGAPVVDVVEPDPEEVGRAARLIAAAQRPVIIAGSDVYAGDAVAALREAAETLQVPVFTNGMGRGALPGHHPLAFAKARRTALRGADVVVVIGTPLDFRLGFGDFGAAQVVHIVDAPSQRATHVQPAVSPAGDLRLILSALADHTGDREDHSGWIADLRAAEDAAKARDAEEMAAETDPIRPARVYGELRRVLAPDAVTIGDGGDFVSYAGKYLEPSVPGTWLDPGPYGCLGTGMGYAMGARVTYPDRQICVLMGDGAAGFSLMDVESLVRQQLPVVIVVGNNGIWGLEKHPMRAMYGYDVAADLQPELRYDDVVRALGGAGETVAKAADLGPALQRAFDSGVPYLVNVLTDPADAYPRSSNLA
ncbi:acetolactate synthase-1/2/3 large subunit [Micromonospora pattaloongensis]|uniref:Acetolactate synthase-1/2/3 large subunit n=1 Tax=Micromonospora pattaloongensis TaxID=405436 RepID=A0A1H3FGN6_9ACTN|nr:acetolactate synthase [Micromonospora pattaloongensis]SDX90283.1 acetolactate synthase-1/2/3 large subunit [Micromonospora pattaloongensis]